MQQALCCCPLDFQARLSRPDYKLKVRQKNPKWYGFNLLEYFSNDPDWMKDFPIKNDGMFQEHDFRWIRRLGFQLGRLPMDYRFWTAFRNLLKFEEDKVAPIDRALELGEKYGIHINLGLHRAPGYCILDTMDEALTGIHVTKEKSSVHRSENARRVRLPVDLFHRPL